MLLTNITNGRAPDGRLYSCASNEARKYHSSANVEQREGHWGYVLKLACSHCGKEIDRAEVFTPGQTEQSAEAQVLAFSHDVQRGKAGGWVRKIQCPDCSICPTCGQWRGKYGNNTGGILWG